MRAEMLMDNITKPYGDKIAGSKPLGCQKCGKPIGYVTILSKGLLGMQNQFKTLRLPLFTWIVLRRKNSD